MRDGHQASSFARSLFSAALLAYVVWVGAHFAAMTYWFSTFRGRNLVTSMEVHTCDLRLGYDLLGIPAAVTLLTLISIRKRSGIAPRLVGGAFGVALAMGHIYYEGCGAVHRLLPAFSGQWWAQKNGAAYALVVLLLVGTATIIAHRTVRRRATT